VLCTVCGEVGQLLAAAERLGRRAPAA